MARFATTALAHHRALLAFVVAHLAMLPVSAGGAGGSSVGEMLRGFVGASAADNLAAPADAKAVDGQVHVVPLHKQLVPVRSEDGVISFKSVYFGNIFLGAPKRQEFSVVFDTGSGHVILPSTLCETETCLLHRRYNMSESAVAQQVDYDGSPVLPGAPRDQITIAFGTGEVTGQFSRDRLCLGVDSSEAGDCIDMQVVMASEMSEDPFATFTFDGVLGLGLDSLALSPEFSFFGMLSRHGNLRDARFGVFLADSDEDFSEISFGGHNPRRVESDLFWAPVASPEMGYWQVQVVAVRVGNVTLDFCKDGTCRAVVDTGTSLIAVPVGVADDLQDRLESALTEPPPSADGKTDCRKASGSELEFELSSGETLKLTPGDYARPSLRMSPEADDAAAVAQAAAAMEGEAAEPMRCHPTLMPVDLPEPIGPKLFIWGEPVLRKYYTTYDWEKKRIGFALASHRRPGAADGAAAASGATADEGEVATTGDAPLLMML
eukprot:TRINITY_DN72048_c0_g1_i1.p1 TRINITY_DN72048_c0_g1~~TRINITY_DN72048_c0_g1_i1.p1  ORF type:complete len:492 (+),score=117.98 TRINITY_DN72048_c0_g1_i1:317-1792(+)